MSRIQVGKYYMQDNAMDVCVLVKDIHANGTATVEWYNVGYTGNPWRITDSAQIIYMHPDVWNDISELVRQPRPEWGS